MTEPRRIIAGRRTADEWENSVGFFGIGKKKWEEQAKAAQAEAEAQADDVKSALPNSDAEASDRTLAERVNEQQRWENSLRRFVQAESTRMQQEEQKSKDTSDLNVDALKQSAQHSGSSAEPSASTAGEARTSGSAEGKKTVGASSQAANADAAQTGSFTQESAQAPDASAPKRAPQISEYRATSMPADAFETNSSATAVPSSNAVSVSGTASVQSEAGSQKQNVQDALKEFNETKYGTEHEGNTSSVSSHADAAASPSSSAEKESADIKTPNVEDREREKLAAGVVSTDAEEKPAFVPAPGVESKNSNDKKTANADSKSTLEATPQESESASDVKTSAYEKKSPSPEVQATNGLESSGTPSASKKSDKIEFVGSGATGSAKHLDDRNDPETLAPEKNRSVETSAEKTSAEKMAVQHEKTVADEVPAHSSTDKDSKKQDVEKIARDEKASQSGNDNSDTKNPTNNVEPTESSAQKAETAKQPENKSGHKHKRNDNDSVSKSEVDKNVQTEVNTDSTITDNATENNTFTSLPDITETSTEISNNEVINETVEASTNADESIEENGSTDKSFNRYDGATLLAAGAYAWWIVIVLLPMINAVKWINKKRREKSRGNVNKKYN